MDKNKKSNLSKIQKKVLFIGPTKDGTGPRNLKNIGKPIKCKMGNNGYRYSEVAEIKKHNGKLIVHKVSSKAQKRTIIHNSKIKRGTGPR